MGDNPSTIPGHDVTLDDFRLCEVPGCIWHVLEPARRCSEHGGPKGPEVAFADDGALLDARHMTLTDD